MNNKFIVLQSNPNSTGGFVTKLQREIAVSDEVFGDKNKRETYYISGTKQLEKGVQIDEKHLFPKYKAVEHPMVNPITGEEFMGKWLHLA